MSHLYWHRGEDVKNNNNESREQKLNYFLEILRKIIIESEYPKDQSQIKKVRYLFELMNRSNALVYFREMVYQNCKVNMKDSLTEIELYEMFDEYIRDIERAAGSFVKTSFSINIQKRIAGDIWLHLLSSNTEKNWIFLFNHSYAFLMSRLKSSRKTHQANEWEIYLYNKMDKLLECSKNKGKQILADLSNYPLGYPFASGVDNLLGKMASEITHEMLGCLLRLPYFEYLKESVIKENCLTIVSS